MHFQTHQQLYITKRNCYNNISLGVCNKGVVHCYIFGFNHQQSSVFVLKYDERIQTMTVKSPRAWKCGKTLASLGNIEVLNFISLSLNTFIRHSLIWWGFSSKRNPNKIISFSIKVWLGSLVEFSNGHPAESG